MAPLNFLVDMIRLTLGANLAVLSCGQELTEAFFNYSDDEETEKFLGMPQFNGSTPTLTIHRFHYVHLLLPFLVGLFLVLCIAGLTYHYRSVVLMKGGVVQRGNCLSSSVSSIASDDESRIERDKQKIKKSLSQSTVFKVRRFMSNFTNMDTIQT